MKTFAKAMVGALAMASAAFATATPANAQASFEFRFGTQPRATYYDPCYRPYYARPAYCRYPRYGGSVFFGGRWNNGPFHYRDNRGYREYWYNNRWWRGDPPGRRNPPGRRRGWR